LASPHSIAGKGEYILLWSFPFVFALWIVAILIFPGFGPVMSASMNAQEVADFYRNPANQDAVRSSMILLNWFSYGVIPMLALVVVQIKRMGHGSAIFAYTFLGSLCCAPVLFFSADLFWLIAAFRPERPPEITQMFNDMAWLAFSAQTGFLIIQSLVLAVAIQFDDRQPKIFPGWFAFFNLGVALALAPSAFTGVNGMTGMFAWDGLFPFWIKNGAMMLWIAVTFFVLKAAMDKQRAEGVAAA
jgi:hypothetical protein